jgi:phage terminase small subunit
MAKLTIPRAPGHLSAARRRLWRSILSDWPISDSAHLAVLESALSALDRAEACRAAIAKTGLVVADRFNQVKPHPLLASERDARAGFLAGIRSLGLDPSDIG